MFISFFCSLILALALKLCLDRPVKNTVQQSINQSINIYQSAFIGRHRCVVSIEVDCFSVQRTDVKFIVNI